MAGGSWRRSRAGMLALALGAVLAPGCAQAHVKWFCAFDVAAQPRILESVVNGDLIRYSLLAVGALLAGCLIEGTPLGRAMLAAIDRVTGTLDAHADLAIRAFLGFFLVALWTMGGVILTPELKTTSTLLPWLQLAMAAGLLSRRTLPLSAAGIVFLYGLAWWNYGTFHLMDYPIFLGIAAYLALFGLDKTVFGLRPIDVLRWAAAITLMWASIEKWAYPQWSFPLLTMYPEMTMGFDPELYMRIAGVVEFALAFALLWTPLVRRVAAAILAGMFVSAVFEFGKIDAIGHAPIVAVMLAILADRTPQTVTWRRGMLAPAAYAAALALTTLLYYGAHAAFFGTSIV